MVAAKPLEDSMPSDHDSANAPATASSVYVIVHLAARPTRHGPRVGIKSWVVASIEWRFVKGS